MVVEVKGRTIDLKEQDDVSQRKAIKLLENQVENVKLAISQYELEKRKNERKMEDIEFEILALEEEFKNKVQSKLNSKQKFEIEVMTNEEHIAKQKDKLVEIEEELKVTLEATKKMEGKK